MRTSRGLLPVVFRCPHHPHRKMVEKIEPVPMFNAAGPYARKSTRKVYKCPLCPFVIAADHTVSHTRREPTMQDLEPWIV